MAVRLYGCLAIWRIWITVLSRTTAPKQPKSQRAKELIAQHPPGDEVEAVTAGDEMHRDVGDGDRPATTCGEDVTRHARAINDQHGAFADDFQCVIRHDQRGRV